MFERDMEGSMIAWFNGLPLGLKVAAQHGQSFEHGMGFRPSRAHCLLAGLKDTGPSSQIGYGAE
ncbi:hypothetical protein F2Q69_00062744 [Brassica cretica]|uniref:Uncharacterized protein n=1 Tax=Brassica cretica TaxID=69181 RepID=A0A8S9RHI7_BRACR|nr:hypothetical protein F2Q69_00062744 [Brassica cretica]